MNFKKLKHHALFSLVIFFIFSCESPEDPRQNKSNIKAVAAIKTEFAEKVSEAIITEANVVYVSVEENGVNQSRFAETICNLLKQHNATSNWVKIVKVGSTNDSNADNSYGVLLGECRCN